MIFNPYALFVMSFGILSLVIAAYAWWRRSTMGAQPFTLFALAMAVYTLGYGMELASPSLDAMLFWSKVQYFGILSFPPLFLIFAIHYTGREKWLNRRNTSLLFFVPAALLIAKLLDGSLHLLYSSVAVDTSGIIPLLEFTRGPLYYLMAGNNLAMVTAGNALLVQKWRFGSSLYRKQITLILIAATIIYAAYGIYLSGVTLLPRLPHLDLSPFAYLALEAAIGLAIFYFRLFDLAPIAREALIERLSDGVIVLDARLRVVDANPQAQKIFGWSQPPTGQPADQIMVPLVDTETLHQLEKCDKVETQLAVDGKTVYYEVTASPLREKRGEIIGHLHVIHDITHRKEIEHKLQELSLADDLTGLSNRRGFRLLANQLVSMSCRMKLNAALIYIDLDRLKWINDTLGHATGDQALIEVGSLLKSVFRSSDLIARFGGDEFVILALETGENTGETMLARLREHLEAHNSLPGRSYRLSFSAGLARLMGENPSTLDALLEEADRAMYLNKKSRQAQVSDYSL